MTTTTTTSGLSIITEQVPVYQHHQDIYEQSEMMTASFGLSDSRGRQVGYQVSISRFRKEPLTGGLLEQHLATRAPVAVRGKWRVLPHGLRDGKPYGSHPLSNPQAIESYYTRAEAIAAARGHIARAYQRAVKSQVK